MSRRRKSITSPSGREPDLSFLWEVGSNVIISEKQLYSKGTGQVRDGGERLVVESKQYSSSSICGSTAWEKSTRARQEKETLIVVFL